MNILKPISISWGLDPKKIGRVEHLELLHNKEIIMLKFFILLLDFNGENDKYIYLDMGFSLYLCYFVNTLRY